MWLDDPRGQVIGSKGCVFTRCGRPGHRCRTVASLCAEVNPLPCDQSRLEGLFERHHLDVRSKSEIGKGRACREGRCVLRQRLSVGERPAPHDSAPCRPASTTRPRPSRERSESPSSRRDRAPRSRSPSAGARCLAQRRGFQRVRQGAKSSRPTLRGSRPRLKTALGSPTSGLRQGRGFLREARTAG